MAVYKDHRSGSWVAKIRDFSDRQFTLTATPENLARHGLPVPARITKRHARSLEAAMHRAAGKRKVRPATANRVMLSEAASRFMAVRTLGPSQKYREQHVIQGKFLSFLTDRPLDAITREDIERFKAVVSPDRSPVTVRGYIFDLRRFFGWCVTNELLEKDPTSGVSLPRQRIFDMDFADKVSEALKGMA